jgi:CDGSH-type Zn-finger protein
MPIRDTENDFAHDRGAMMTETVLRVRPNGPNIVTGDFVVVGTRTATGAKASATLCRCGKSGDKPFCDGTHTKIGFQDPGLLPADTSPGTPSRGSVTITPTPDGPLECMGPLTIQGADGRTATSEETWLCRCGQSRTKPFCDGSHEKTRFKG